ncbi:hypothetical protein D3C86_1930090 [compost metagenome]
MPLGLDGELMNTQRVRGVMAASSWTAMMRKPLASLHGTTTGTPPAISTMSAYDVQ